MSARGALTGSIGAAVLGGVIWAIGLVVDPHEAWLAYLTAGIATLTIVLGALSLVLMAQLTDATWFVAVRPAALAVASSLPAILVLLIPLTFGLARLYPWIAPSALAPASADVVARQRAYLNLPFFIVRAIVYVVAWLVILRGVRRWSARRESPDVEVSFAGGAAAAAIVLGFTLTFASFDWMMSLQPEWSSTIYGVRVFAASIVPALALVAVLGQSRAGTAGPGQLHALASLLLSFVIFWFYIAFSQLLIIWIGNEPREIAWYLPRAHGAWEVAGVALLIGHFVIPLLALLQKAVKRSGFWMSCLGVWLLVMHFVDVCWLLLPGVATPPGRSLWMYPAAVAVFVGASVAITLLRPAPRVRGSDAELAAALAYDYEEA